MGVAWSEPKYGAFGFIVALIGVATAYLFARILYRHSQWSVWYVRRGQSLAAEIFPPKSELKPGLVAGWVVWFLSKIFGSPDEIGQLPPGPIARWVVSVLLFVAAVWFVIVIFSRHCPSRLRLVRVRLKSELFNLLSDFVVAVNEKEEQSHGDVEWRFSANNFERLPRLAQELVALNPEVIFANTMPATKALAHGIIAFRGKFRASRITSMS